MEHKLRIKREILWETERVWVIFLVISELLTLKVIKKIIFIKYTFSKIRVNSLEEFKLLYDKLKNFFSAKQTCYNLIFLKINCVLDSCDVKVPIFVYSLASW